MPTTDEPPAYPAPTVPPQTPDPEPNAATTEAELRARVAKRMALKNG